MDIVVLFYATDTVIIVGTNRSLFEIVLFEIVAWISIGSSELLSFSIPSTKYSRATIFSQIQTDTDGSSSNDS